MGGQVCYSEARKAGVIVRSSDRGSHMLEFVSGTRQARIDERPVRLTSAPRWLQKQRELFVPLEPMVKAFGLRPRWDRENNVLALDSVEFEDFPGFEIETLPENYGDTQELIPKSVSLRRQGPGLRQVGLSLHLQVTTNAVVQPGQQGLFLLAKYLEAGDGGYQVRGRNTSVPTVGPAPKDPCRKRGREFVCCSSFLADYGGAREDNLLDFILGWVHLRLPSSTR